MTCWETCWEASWPAGKFGWPAQDLLGSAGIFGDSSISEWARHFDTKHDLFEWQKLVGMFKITVDLGGHLEVRCGHLEG